MLVDTSKQVRRLLELATVPGINLRVLHLVRDGRGYVFSRGKRRVMETPAGVVETRPVPTARASLQWVRTNLLAWAVCARLFRGRTLTVSYDAFCADPQGTLKSILSFLDRDAGRAVVGDPGKERHDIAGNNSRFLEDFSSIAPDRAWKRELPVWKRGVFGLIGGWLNPLLKRRAARQQGTV